MRPEFLFVYGTLLSVAEHPMGRLLRESADEEGPGFIPARLYLIEEIDQFGTTKSTKSLSNLYNLFSPEGFMTMKRFRSLM